MPKHPSDSSTTNQKRKKLWTRIAFLTFGVRQFPSHNCSTSKRSIYLLISSRLKLYGFQGAEHKPSEVYTFITITICTIYPKGRESD